MKPRFRKAGGSPLLLSLKMDGTDDVHWYRWRESVLSMFAGCEGTLSKFALTLKKLDPPSASFFNVNANLESVPSHPANMDKTDSHQRYQCTSSVASILRLSSRELPPASEIWASWSLRS
jgi:hypothetical protein